MDHFSKMPIGVDPEIPEDEVRLVSATQMVRLVNLGKPKPIEPASIDKTTAAYKFGWNHASASPYIEAIRMEDYYRPNLWQRIHGYTANPYTCGHYKKRFKTRWVCIDCGSEL